MGAHGFTYYQSGADLEKALKAANEQDTYEYGRDPYSGTMGQKSHAVRYPGPALSEERAQKIANEILDDWEGRTRWGQIAGEKWNDTVVAIPVKTATRSVKVTKIAGTLGDKAKILELVVEQARKQRKIRRGEKPERAWLSSYSTPRARPASYYGYSSRVVATEGTATLIVRKGPKAYNEQTEPDGWLFVGTAAS